jgi:hypothetical protein
MVYAQSDNVQITNYSHYMDMLGNIVVVGEVQNIGSSVIEFVIVSGAITGMDGSYVEAGNRVWGSYLLPGQKAPFYLDFLAQYTNSQTWFVGIADIQLNVYRAPVTTQFEYQGVKILNDKPAPASNGEYWVNGELKNNGEQRASNITVFATFYNSSGSVIATGFSNIINSIVAGGSNTFKVAAFDLNQTIVNADQKISGYSLIVQVEAPMQTGSAPTASSTIVPVPTTTPTIYNDNSIDVEQQNLTYVGVVFTIVIVIILISVLLKRFKPKNKINPQKQIVKNTKHRVCN